MRFSRALVPALVALAALVDASPAGALCPNCLGQDTGSGLGLRLVGLFVLLPVAVFFTVAIAIRRLTREPSGAQRPSGAPPSAAPSAAPASSAGGVQAG
jgi:hypothetical protein